MFSSCQECRSLKIKCIVLISMFNSSTIQITYLCCMGAVASTFDCSNPQNQDDNMHLLQEFLN